MSWFFARSKTSALTALVASTCVMLGGCTEEPSSPSITNDSAVLQSASFASLFTIEPRPITTECGLNQPCTLQVTVSTSGPVTLDWGMDALGIILDSGSSCPVASFFFGECTINLKAPDTSQPARFIGKLKIGNLETGVYKTFRVTVRVK